MEPEAPKLAEKAPVHRHRVRSFWRGLLLLNRGMSGVDRASGGALFFNTGVKLLAYAGLCLIVFILIEKVKEIEAQLDPIGAGLLELKGQLQRAGTDVGRDAQASQKELVTLQQRARNLKDELDRASQEHQRLGVKSLAEADEEARDLADMLARDAAAPTAMDPQREAAAQALADFAAALQSARAELQGNARGLADGGVATEAALASLAARAQAETDALGKQEAAAKLARLASGADALLADEQALAKRLAALSDRLGKAAAAIPEPPRKAPPPKLAAGRRAEK